MESKVARAADKIRRDMRKEEHVSQVKSILALIGHLTEGCELPSVEELWKITSKIPVSVVEAVERMRKSD